MCANALPTSFHSLRFAQRANVARNQAVGPRSAIDGRTARRNKLMVSLKSETIPVSETIPAPVDPSRPAKRSFAAMRHPGFRAQFITFVLAMMADNIEHVISYWMLYQKFHSPALAGFAIVSHWLPFLLFSVASGALADRFDPRRIIQIGMVLFIIASLSWSYFFVTGTLQMWQAMVILVIHGCAGVLWQTPNQMLLYDIVGPSDLESAVRLNAMARYLAVLVGPAVGAAILLAFGPAPGIMLNTVFYLPLVLWLVNAPYGPRFRAGKPAPRRAVRGLGDIVQTMRDIRVHSVIVSMTLLAGAASFFVGNAYSSQMPGFANDLGHGDPGLSYSLLLAADAAGGLLGRHLCSKAGDCCRRGRAPRSCSPCCGAWRWRSSRWPKAIRSPRLPVCRGIPGIILQRHGAEPGPAECSARQARTRHRPVQYVEPRAARLQRHFRWPVRQPDRRALVACAVGSRHIGDRRRTAGHPLTAQDRRTRARGTRASPEDQSFRNTIDAIQPVISAMKAVTRP